MMNIKALMIAKRLINNFMMQGVISTIIKKVAIKIIPLICKVKIELSWVMLRVLDSLNI